MSQALTSEAKSIYGNPWRHDQWNITTQGKFVSRYGLPKAEEFAKLAGSKIGNTKPTIPGELSRVITDNRTYIFNRNETGGSGGGGGGIIGAGSSGNGPPT